MKLNLPNEYKQNMINRRGKEILSWLDSIDKIFEKYIINFKLSNIELVPNLTMNVLLYAVSKEYGNVVIKLSPPGKTAINEINYFKINKSKYMPNCYYYNLEDRVIIMERITPANTLQDVTNIDARVKIFCDILDDILIKSDFENNFSTYDQLIDAIASKIKVNKELFAKYEYIEDMLDKVIKTYDEIKKLNLPKYIIHNDLQHKNILKSGNNFKVIDPQGKIAEKVFDTTQFIRVEIRNNGIEKIDEIITMFSNYLGEDKKLLYKALYISVFEKLVFFIKSKYDQSIIKYNYNLCKYIGDNI